MLNMHKTYKTLLKGATRALLSCLTLMGAMLPVACVYEQIPAGEPEQDTYIHLNLSSTEAQTRAVSDKYKGETGENLIHSLRVWAFDSDNGSGDAIALCYQEETEPKAENGQHTFTMKLPRKTGGQDLKHIDLYILANAEEAGTNLTTPALNRMSTRKQLQEKVISEQFGVNTEGDPQRTVPKGGIPMSRIVERIPIEGNVTEDPNSQNPSIKIALTRAVSKLHFFFARRTDAGTDHVQVTGIEVGASTIPERSFVFPQPVTYANPIPEDGVDTRSYDTYVNYAVTRKSDVKADSIQAVADPKTFLRGADEDADRYMARLAKGGLKGKYLTYLRETDREVPVTIRYRLGENEDDRTATVKVKAGDLRRNHEVVIYGYFLDGGALMVEPQVLPWSETPDYEYNSQRQITLSYNDARQTMDEENVPRVAVAWQDWTTGATLTRSPLITMDIKVDSYNWVLQTDNPAFGFIKEGETEIQDVLTGTNGTVNFYFVPRKRQNLAVKGENYDAKVFLTLPAEDNSLVLINKGDNPLPGDAGGNYIYFRQVSEDKYSELSIINGTR